MSFVRSTWRGIAGIMAMVAMVASLVSMPAVSVAAQVDGNTYTFASGQVLAWSGSWTLDPDSVSQEGGLEMVLLSQQLSFLAVMSVPAGVDLDTTRDTFLDGFLGAGDDSITIDRGSYGAVSYSLDTINYDGIDMGAFTLFRSSADGGETFAWVFVSLVDTFADEFAVAQNAFTLDGNAPFTGIEGQGLEDQLVTAVANGNVPDNDDETPVADDGDAISEPDGTDSGDETTPEGDTGTTGGGGGLKGGTSQTTGNDATAETDAPTAETDEPTTEANDTPAGETGLIDDSTFVSPAYGYTVEWDANFVLDPSSDPNPSATTDGVEIVKLASPVEGTPYFVTVSVAPTTLVATDYARYWASDEYLADTAISPNAEIVLVEGNDEIAGVVMVDYLESGTVVVTYNEFHVDVETGTLVRYQYLTSGPLVASTLPLAQDGITVDGEPGLTFFSTDEVVEAIAGL